MKEGKTVRNYQERRKWWFLFKKYRLGSPETNLANSPRSTGFSLDSCILGGHMAKRMDISCILFTVPTSLEGKTSTSEPLCRASSTRRRVPCSVEMDKTGRYACLDTAALTPRPGFRVNVQRGAWSFCQAQSSVRSWPVDPAPPQFCLPSLEEPSHKPEVTTWNLRKPSHTPARAQGHMLKENVYIKNLGFVDQIYHQKAP